MARPGANRTVEDRARFGLGTDSNDGTDIELSAEGVIENATIVPDEPVADAHLIDAVAAHASTAVSVDTTSVIGTGTEVQTVLEAITAEFVTPTHSHGGAGETVLVNLTDQNLATTTEEDVVFGQITLTAGIYEVDASFLFKGSAAGQGGYIGYDGPADLTTFLRFRASTSDSAHQMLSAATTGDLAATSGGSCATGTTTWGIVEVIGRLVVTTGGAFKWRVYADHADPVLKAGSVFKYMKAS